MPNNLTKSSIRALIGMTMLVLVSGCAIGGARYGCGAPQGVTCMSAREVYERTNDADHVAPTSSHATRSRSDAAMEAVEYGAPTHRPARDTAVVIQRGALTFAAADNASASVLAGGPVASGPVRTPPKVMRVWVNAWEDQAGDLHGAAAVYTEIQPRRWSIGERQTPAGQTLRLIEPLSGTTTQARANTTTTPPSILTQSAIPASEDHGG